MIEIRRASPPDGGALGEIHAEAWKAAYAPFFAPEFAAQAVRDRRTRWHARVAAGPETVLLASLDGRPLALAFFGPSADRPGLAELYSFYGHPDGWGSGIAAALIDATLCRMSEGGAAGAHLWTLRDTPQSRRFYTKSGFTETGGTRLHDFGDGSPLQQVEYERVFTGPSGRRHHSAHC
ncbi:GNAT family N-acetyltransferase [Streptomyces antarcticus]|uniref:GNAT family N-acetyltransferase n=1 Tax=Streptomyces antarcticus TaxID=2996458 RepID=UPI002271656D|nr:MULTISPECIES: GNAT family N-acetyltransferase [unclassified Streptomyces]MCY0944971.1 GNAT family N-acetyltransferase [Streptomyces sp. H34-AA3]MCZ4082143.1 GNAT family N-acetyltransferase [Streptomyces sp. H34-S5]